LLLVSRTLVGLVEDHAVVVSVHDATHIRAKIEHHVYQCEDRKGVIGSLHHVLPRFGLVPLCGR